jgi:hypothetical protein
VLKVEIEVFVLVAMEEYLKVNEVIDWKHPDIMERAKQIASEFETPMAIAPFLGIPVMRKCNR